MGEEVERDEAIRRQAEMAREITGLRNSYWTERKARLDAEAQVEAMRKALESVEPYLLDKIREAGGWASDPTAHALLGTLRAALASSTPESRWNVAKVGRNITISAADAGVGNAVLSPEDEESGCYWTLIGSGPHEQQNALAQVIADALNAVVKAEESAVYPEWQPIETAPRDGTAILAASTNHDHVEVVCWQDGLPSGSMSDEPEEGWVNNGALKDRFYANPRWFTHWMPLRPAPAEARGSQPEGGQ